ncbi:benzoate 4-monooxygenase cytochrome P450 [Pseudovirgaria hyperparasitica]|uniref:Benzoate 4-monooxygenase cytochrome P450 n=1 Tax=Pseudovirgaria hyperparasitica TaxID=470096 RepID=A0A6A6W5D4_9PEZI|nr:benzoate 4-monooxygenase cytochrome P450 [Pseudovirgaria hyperparasitica]KAF2757755.1 benzoate 4-monooxygenase cytochrome P450 [Pseudovirgaria hyperparasitica]
MVQAESLSLPLVAFAAGIALHVFAFRFGEWDRSYHKAAAAYALLAVVGAAYTHFVLTKGNIGLVGAFRTITYLELVSILGIFTSMSIYRTLFHRLNRFPGPFGARVSNWYITSLAVKNFQIYREIEQFHQKYGDFVRIGPTEISVNNVDAVQKLHSATTKCTKGPWYDLSAWISLHTTRNKAEHARRRKAWDRGFNARALRHYEPRVVKYTNQLLSQIEKHAGKPMNMSDWFNFYSFDIMGDLAFGAQFDMLKDGVKHYFMVALHGFVKAVGILSYAIWIIPVFRLMPVLNAEDQKFWKWVGQQIDKRRQTRLERPDVFSWILEDHQSKKKPTRQDELNLIGDGALIAVAGSDTTAAALTMLFYELSQHPEIVEKLQKEVDQAFEKGEIDYNGLSKYKYLQACIDESLRLHPPVPSGLQRVTPPQGLEIAGTYIPGNSFVKIPIHTLQRDERNFGMPLEFIPERWTDHPELVKNADAFMPFSIGPYGCVGKQLALMEVRSVTAHILHEYNVRTAPGFTQENFLKEKKDCFALELGPLELIFEPRT